LHHRRNAFRSSGDEKHIIVLFNDKTWSQFDDMWKTALLEDSCPDVIVASNRTKPRRSSGKIWRELSGVRGKIGSATGAGSGFASLVQAGECGQMCCVAKNVSLARRLIASTRGTWLRFACRSREIVRLLTKSLAQS
jgi:hypothetical protein